jgi:hypothetical protein
MKFMKVAAATIIVLLFGVLGNAPKTAKVEQPVMTIQSVTPVAIKEPPHKRLERLAVMLKAPKQKAPRIAKSIMLAHQATGWEPELILSIMTVENPGFEYSAVSCKGYKGLMQTKPATGIPEVDTVHGAMVLSEKYAESKGSVGRALAMYNGGKYWRSGQCQKYVSDVLKIYKDIKNK